MAKRILIVEDSPTISRKLEELLTRYGYEVECIHTPMGIVVLNTLRKFNPNLIILDIRLGNLDGVDLCQTIRHFPRFADTPILMLSGLTSEEVINRALDAGANDYITKPFEDSDLLHIVSKYLHHA